jgi:hypothetical protein
MAMQMIVDWELQEAELPQGHCVSRAARTIHHHPNESRGQRPGSKGAENELASTI